MTVESVTRCGPDFVILGAMKCGTSTLAAQLAAQEGVFLTTPKEPNYFSDDAVFARGGAWYAALFAAAAPGDLTGEASTHYTKLPTHPKALPRLTAALEEPAPGRLRFVYMIRDPLDRAVSHYIHEWTQGVITCDFETALHRHPELVEYGCYGHQIAGWVEQFGVERIHVTSLEALQANPLATLGDVAAHLGLRTPVIWVEAESRQNVSAERIRRLPLQGLIFDNPVATALRRALVPQALRDRIKRSRQMQDRPQMLPATKARLRARFAEDRTLLEALLGPRDDIALAYASFDREQT